MKMLGLSGLSLLLAKCSPHRTDASGAASTAAPPAASATGIATLPVVRPTAAPVYRSRVAIGQSVDYQPARLRQALERMLDDIGGLADLVRSGARVGIKPNLTGGTFWDAGLPIPATELFATHPALVGALAGILLDAGAGKVTVLEGLGDELIFPAWGYADMAKPLGIGLVDLCKPDPYPKWKIFPVGPQSSVYETFSLNPVLGGLDVFVSVGKMKCHATTGVTLSLKNLFGIAPIGLYKRHADDNNRSAFHGDATYDTRVPGVILDLNLARPVHLAIVDGILTGEGGAGPWDVGLSPVRPGVLVASRDPVAADAVATAIMGFDPQAPSSQPPFTGGDNHLALASRIGLGTNRLDEIGLAGPQILDVKYPFEPVK